MTALLALLHAVHLLAIDVAAGGPLLYLILPRPQASDPDPPTIRLARQLGWAILAGFLIGSLAGLLLGTVLVARGRSALAANLPVFGPKIVLGIWQWFFFLAVWAILQGVAYRRPRARWALVGLGLIAGTNLLYHFPPLFTLLAAAPLPLDTQITAAQFRSLAASPAVLAMWVHVALAALAVAPLALAWLAMRLAQNPGGRELLARVTRRALAVALAATALQLPAGIALLANQDPLAQIQLTGGDLAATLALALAVILTLFLLYQLAEALGNTTPDRLHASIITTVLIVLLMCTTLVRLRTVSWTRDIGRQSSASQEQPPWNLRVYA